MTATELRPEIGSRILPITAIITKRRRHFAELVEAALAQRDALRDARCKNRHPRAKHREIITAT